MATDPDRPAGRLSTDRETIRGWASEHNAVPVRMTGVDEPDQVGIVPESALGGDHERIEWDEFFTALEDRDLVLRYHSEDPADPFEVVDRERAIARADIEREEFEERLLSGETITSEITETTVVERVVVEEATVESDLVGSEVVDEQVVDVELLDRECVRCDLVEGATTETASAFDTDRYLAMIGGMETGVGTRTETGVTEESEADEQPPRDVETMDAEVTVPYDAELDVEETWAVTRDVRERFTVESRVTHTEATESDVPTESDVEVESDLESDVDVEQLQRTIVEEGLLDVEASPERIMSMYDVETEFAEGDRIHTYFYRDRVVEDEVVARRRLTAEVVGGSAPEFELVRQQEVTADMEETVGATGEEAGVVDEGAGVVDEEAGMAGRVTLEEDDVGKAVVDATGEEIGMVAEVGADGATMYVDPHPSITDRIKAALDWGGADEDAAPVHADQIDRVTEDRIELKAEEHLEGRHGGI